MVDEGSVRVNKALALDDLYVGPGTRILTYLEPKVYRAPVNVINHPAVSASKVDWWKVDWKLVRKTTPNWFLVDKPAGISSIATRDFARGTLVPYWLRKYISRNLGSAGVLTTSRLDVGTHGLIVVGRKAEYVGKHNDLIESRNIRKHYTAVVTGWKRPHIRRFFNKDRRHEIVPPQWYQPSKPLPASQAESIISNLPEGALSQTLEVNGVHYDFPKRTTGLWEHFIPEKGSGEKEIPDPPYGSVHRMSSRVGEWDHLRVASSRDQGEGFEVPVRLIVENAREADANSVALRAFPRAWAERLVDQAKLIGEPLYEVDIELLTGKTHQIRTQLECEGLTIIGDWLYGSPYLPDPNAFALCCRKLEWRCPIEKKTISYDLRDHQLLPTENARPVVTPPSNELPL